MSDQPSSARSISLRPDKAAIAACLRKQIEQALPRATVKIWHGMPVWFIGENPVVGYSTKLTRVTLRFWNGQSFDEPMLTPGGEVSLGANQIPGYHRYRPQGVAALAPKAKTNVWDMVAARNRIFAPDWLRGSRNSYFQFAENVMNPHALIPIFYVADVDTALRVLHPHSGIFPGLSLWHVRGPPDRSTRNPYHRSGRASANSWRWFRIRDLRRRR